MAGNAYWDSYGTATNAFAQQQQTDQRRHDAFIADQQRQTDQTAGNAFASGDYAGAANAYARGGDVGNAGKVLDWQAAHAKATRDAADAQRKEHAALTLRATDAIDNYTRANPGTDPLAAFDKVAPLLSQLGPPEEVSQLREAFARDPAGTLAAARAMAQRELQIVPGANGAYSAVDKGTGRRVGGYQPAVPGKIEGFSTENNVYQTPGTPESYFGSAGEGGGPAPTPTLVQPGQPPAAAPGGPPAASGAPPAAVAGGRLDPVAFFNEFVAPHEGGLNPSDANGSPTNFGINQAANPGVDVHNLTRDQAAQIFAQKYFAASGAGNLPPGLAAVVADTAFINPSAAQRFLKQSGGDPQKFMDLRDQWMQGMIARDPQRFGKYAQAWSTRNRDLRAYAQQAGGGDGQAPQPQAPQGGAPRLIQRGVPKPSSEDDGVEFTPGAIESIAQKYELLGNAGIPPLGQRAGKVRAMIMNRVAEIEAATGTTGADAVARWADMKAQSSELRDATLQRGRMQVAESTAESNADLMLSLAPKGAGPTNIPVVNRWLQAGRKQIAGDPDVTAFDIAIGTFADEYAKVVSGATGSQASTDSARAEAYRRLSQYATKGQLEAGVSTMKAEMANRTAAQDARVAAAIGHIRGAGGQSGGAQNQPGPGHSGYRNSPDGRHSYPVFTPEQYNAAKSNPANRGKHFYDTHGNLLEIP